jgi:hypothetical protein
MTMKHASTMKHLLTILTHRLYSIFEERGRDLKFRPLSVIGFAQFGQGLPVPVSEPAAG